MRHNFSLPLAIASLLTMSACTQNDSSYNDIDGQTPIVLKANQDDSGDVPSRAAQQTAGTITSFGVSASVYGASSTYTSAGCGSLFYNLQVQKSTGATGYYWPTNDYKLSFFGYYPYGNAAITLSAATTTGRPSYTVTIPENAANQIDFMTAELLDQGYTTTPPASLSLSFAHRLTDIRFKAYNQQASSLTVKSIAIYGVKYTGTYTTGTSWSLSGSVNSSSSHPFQLSLNTAVASKATVDLTGTSNHFIILPQTVASGTNFFVIKTIEDSEERTYTYTLDTDYVLVMGRSVTFNLTLGNGELTVNPVTVVDWEPES